MKSLFIGAALLIGAASIPALAQTSPSSAQPNASSERQNEPGAGGRSKVGIPGQPGNKSGPAADKSTSGSGAASGEKGGAAGADESQVPGFPGNKSGPAEKMPPK
jgi:hypothetical protein